MMDAYSTNASESNQKISIIAAAQGINRVSILDYILELPNF